MAFKDLQHYIEALEARPDLKRIRVSVDPELEITEIVLIHALNGQPRRNQRVDNLRYRVLPLDPLAFHHRIGFTVVSAVDGPFRFFVKVIVLLVWKQEENVGRVFIY